MSLLQKLIGMGLRPRVRGKARGTTFEEQTEHLEESSAKLMPRIRNAKDTPGNREALNHFVGIERWSLSRIRGSIRVAKGEPFVLDSYHGYRLPDNAPLEELQDAFAAVRDESIALARELAASSVDPNLKIPHNDLGELTVVEWFAYIDDHTRREIVRIREASAS